MVGDDHQCLEEIKIMEDAENLDLKGSRNQLLIDVGEHERFWRTLRI